MDTSLLVLEAFFGEELLESHADVVKGSPDEQVLDLFERLANCWTLWFSNRFDRSLAPDTYYFVGERYSRVDPLPLGTYKQLAMYFPAIAAPDPIEAVLCTHIQYALVFGKAFPKDLKRDLPDAIRRLAQIAPLVRSGAVRLVPTAQAGLSEGVQAIARRELDSTTNPALNGKVPQDLEEFACATGICSMAAYWPVASSSPLWKRLRDGGRRAAAELQGGNLPVEEAVTEFDVPSVSRIAMRDLVQLRANESAFADFREAFGVAIRDAADQKRAHGQRFAESVLRDRLIPHQERCANIARRTGVLDGLMLPAGAALAVGGLAWSFSTGDDPLTSIDNMKKLATNMVGPGLAWVAARAMQAKLAPDNPALAVYSALIEKP